MAKIVEFEFEDGGTIRIEATASLDEFEAQPAGVSDLIQKASEKFEEALAVITPTVKALLRMLHDIGPSEIGIEFGVKVSADAGVLIARAGTEANFKVSLKWAPEHAGES